MSKFILGKKMGMTQVFEKEGKVIPLTLIQAGPVIVTQIKTEEKDGYNAVQVGFGEKKIKNIKKPQGGHTKKIGEPLKKIYNKGQTIRWLREFRFEGAEAKADDKNLNVGDIIDASAFSIGDKVKVRGTSKAKGFQGVVRRHGFRGSPASHGHRGMLRKPGSIGQRFPQHTLKGTRMAGRMGGAKITTRGLEVVRIEKENNIMAVKGAVPGRKGTLLEIISM